jgi:hypothetical protein
MLGRTVKLSQLRARFGMVRLALLASAVLTTAGCSSEAFVSKTSFPEYDCSICHDVAARTAECNLLDDETTAADYQKICEDGLNELCADDGENFIGLAANCLTDEGCDAFSDCYFLVVASFKDRTGCVGSCTNQ